MNTTDEGFSFSFHKNYKLGPTYPRLAIFSLRPVTSNEPVCFESWNKFSVYQLASNAGVFRGARFSSLYEKRAPLKTPAWEARYQTDLPENQIWHTDEAGASLACYQSTLISETSFFSQWYFPSSGRSTNEILWEIVASSPFPCPSRLRRSLARSRETPLTRPNRRACSQAKFVFSYLLACLKSGRHV